MLELGGDSVIDVGIAGDRIRGYSWRGRFIIGSRLFLIASGRTGVLIDRGSKV